MQDIRIDAAAISSILERNAEAFAVEMGPEEIGHVLEAGNGIAHVDGLPGVMAEEMVVFPGEIYGMANAFLLSGVRHYIGTVWEVQDEPSAAFAVSFYKALLDGQSVGESLYRARRLTASRFGEQSLIWASYILYGDPTTRYMTGQRAPELAESGQSKREVVSATEGTSVRGTATGRAPRPDSARAMESSHSWTGRAVLLAVATLLLLGAISAIRHLVGESGPSHYGQGYSLLHAGKLEKARAAFETLLEKGKTAHLGHEGLAALHYETGDEEKAWQTASLAGEQRPQRVYPHTLKGHILLHRGDMKAAEGEYRTAVLAAEGAAWQRAEAFNMLGRLASLRHDRKGAIRHYEEAVRQVPTSAEALCNLAVVWMEEGGLDEARTHLADALETAPDDPLAGRLRDEVEKRLERTQETERRERIDTLVRRLVERHRKSAPGGHTDATQDQWRSRPVTLCFLGIEERGEVTPRAGEKELILAMMQRSFQETERVEVVERAFLEALLRELEIGSSELADPDRAIHVGRVLAARVIATGNLIRHGGTLQMSLRLIETETTLLKGTVVEILSPETRLDRFASTLADKISALLEKAYPLHGEVASVEGDSIVIDIGEDVGLQAGTRMDILEDDGGIIAEVEIEEITAEAAQGRILTHAGEVLAGQRVVERR